MTTDDPDTTPIRYGDKLIPIGERFDVIDGRFDKIQKSLLLEGAGILLLIGIHIPEVGPILNSIAKIVR